MATAVATRTNLGENRGRLAIVRFKAYDRASVLYFSRARVRYVYGLCNAHISFNIMYEAASQSVQVRINSESANDLFQN